MENKINIAELLKDCPQGMELDCTMFDNVTFVRVDNNREQFPIEIAVGGLRSKYLTKEGCFHDPTLLPEAKCVIFPKGTTTWEGFVPPCRFMDGDVVATQGGEWIGITEGGKNRRFIPTYCVINSDGEFKAYFIKKEKWCFDRLATEEEKAKLFKTIKDNGYKWNDETKTLEKLIEPKFKVGDRIQQSKARDRKDNIYTITKVDDVRYHIEGCHYSYTLPIAMQDHYILVPNKFDIKTLKPFESRVLVRNDINQLWIPAFFGYKRDNGYATTFGWCQYCIPYEGNEHLLNTANDCVDFYKIWEE